MKSKILLSLLLIVGMLSFGGCGDTATDNNDTIDNGTVTEEMDKAANDAQEDVNELDGKDTTHGAEVDKNEVVKSETTKSE